MNAPRRRASWATVARREILAQLTDRAFWIGTLATLALVVLGLGFGVVSATGGGTTRVAVSTDESMAVVQRAAASGVAVEAVEVAPDELRSSISGSDADAALEQVPGGWVLTVSDLTDTPDLADAITHVQISANATALGVDPADVLADTTLSVVPLEGDDLAAVAVFIATAAFSVLFMLAAVTYGMQIAQSVVTEKESRVVEILAAAIPVRQLLIGKVVGNMAMALGQVVLIVGVALLGLSWTDFAPLLGVVGGVVGWFVLFFIVGFASLACLWAAAGAMATRVQDLSQTTTPLTMVIMLVYFAGFFARGTAATVLSYVPIASTVTMPGRLMSGDAGWLDAVLALVVAAAFMTATIWVGDRIYRRGLLQTGTVLKLRDALRRAD
ncbi:ABC transporter permease [Tessaracoccus palaemonis]|uniref:ABC transporter permease n=1 Tax=Tessaracoccus palaemonis TaxID=2829499 RepID=A0ABX8SF72_9ACTN|nr:ABC transporter permease [Tessaracoccus palaemonis]QXT62063.1 ABC transporter permease [Tessaracoccus palaemonis]